MDPKTSFYFLLVFIARAACSRENCLCARGFCDDGWVQYQDSCYKAVMEPAKWPEAEMTCQSHSRHSHLASIHSAEENDFIFHLMGKPLDYTKGQAYWIGAHDTFMESSFTWTDGSEYNYKHFTESQPDGLPGEHYLGSWILKNDLVTWNDYGASWSFLFVCKYTLQNRGSACPPQLEGPLLIWWKTWPVYCGGGCVTVLCCSFTSGTIYCWFLSCLLCLG